jgi:hypothetical protein
MVRRLGAPVTDPLGNRASIMAANPTRAAAGLDFRRHLPESGIGFRLEQATGSNGSGAGDFAQIVAKQIDNHDVLGFFFWARSKGSGEGPVFFFPPPARGRAFHGARHQSISMLLKKQFRRQAQNFPSSKIHVGRIGRPLGLPEPAIPRPGIARPLAMEWEREIDLVGVSPFN